MPFGASRAGLMSTRVDAIPDSVDYHLPFDEGEGDELVPDIGDVTATFIENAVWDDDSRYFGDTAPILDASNNDVILTDDTLPVGNGGTIACWISDNGGSDDNNRFIKAADEDDSAPDTSFNLGYDGSARDEFRVVTRGGEGSTVNLSLSGPDATEEDVFTVIADDGDGTVKALVYDSEGLVDSESDDGSLFDGPEDLFITFGNRPQQDASFDGTIDTPLASFDFEDNDEIDEWHKETVGSR